jgi:hypothetical protein
MNTTIFCCNILWPSNECIHPLMHRHLLRVLLGNFLPSRMCYTTEFEVICVRKCRESGSKFVEVRTAKWVDSSKPWKIDMLSLSVLIPPLKMERFLHRVTPQRLQLGMPDSGPQRRWSLENISKLFDSCSS